MSEQASTTVPQPFIYDYQKTIATLGATERKASMTARRLTFVRYNYAILRKASITAYRYMDGDLEIGMTKLIRNNDDVLECQAINLILPPDRARKLRDYLISVYPLERR